MCLRPPNSPNHYPLITQLSVVSNLLQQQASSHPLSCCRLPKWDDPTTVHVFAFVFSSACDASLARFNNHITTFGLTSMSFWPCFYAHLVLSLHRLQVLWAKACWTTQISPMSVMCGLKPSSLMENMLRRDMTVYLLLNTAIQRDPCATPWERDTSQLRRRDRQRNL